jgi:O-antigen ligase
MMQRWKVTRDSLHLERPERMLWAAALVTLPVTSFRYFPFLGDTTYVRPLALYPLSLLLLLLLVDWLRAARRFPWTGSVILLAVFTLAVAAATSGGFLLDPIPLRGQTYLGRALRAASTLVIGISFFVAAASMNHGSEQARFTFRWTLVGFAATLAWSALQAVTFYTDLLDKEVVTHWQLAFSVRELVRTNRISGLAYEPAWLAAQVATIYAPFLVGAVLTGFRATRYRWLEPTLLGLALILVLATYSRGGILITFGAIALTLVLAGGGALRAFGRWFAVGFRAPSTALFVRLGVIAATIAVLLGVFTFLSQKNYFRRLWQVSAGSFGEYIIDINAGARSAYAAGALAAFHEHPLMGVGLGASGFHIYQNLPDWSLTFVPEIARQLNPESRLFPNPKDLYIRVLVEAGLVGLALFLAFQWSVLGDALAALGRKDWRRLFGIAGLLSWLAISLYNVTQDSFATPNIWLVPGLLAGLSLQIEETAS